MFKAGSRNVPFDHDGVKYRCCCESIHVKQGVFVIAIISSFFIVCNLVLKAAGLSDIGWNWELLFLIVDTAVVLSLFYGIITEKAALLQPFVVLNVLTISFLILLSIFFISAAYDSHSYAAEYVELAIGDRMQEVAEIISVPQENDKEVELGSHLRFVVTLSIFVTIALAITTSIHCWFMIVVVRCARYFRDLEPVKRSFMEGYSTEWLTDSNPFEDGTPSKCK